MRTLANLFLVLFFADGYLSLCDELVSLFAPVAPLTLLRGAVANLVIYLAAQFYLALGIDQRLPKRLFIPLTLFVFLVPLSVWLFPSLAGRPFGLFAAAFQVALVTLLLLGYRKGGNPFSFKLPRAQFDAPRFSWKNTLPFAAGNLLLLPVLLATLGLCYADAWAANATSGLMRVEPRGLYMVERVYRRGDRTVRLTGMIHVGERQYYRDVARLASSGRTLVLAEGVTDDQGVLRNKFDYGKVASVLGLTPQKKNLIPGRVIEPEALEAESPPESGKVNTPDVLRADLDVSSFHPETLCLLETIGRSLRDNPTLLEAVIEINDQTGERITPESYRLIMDDILHRRNKALLGHLDKALKRYDTVVIPWGALHMKEIEAQVLKRGFVLQEEHKRLGVDFKRIIAG